MNKGAAHGTKPFGPTSMSIRSLLQWVAIVCNAVNFGLPANIVAGPGLGQISRTAGTSRQIQFSLKILY